MKTRASDFLKIKNILKTIEPHFPLKIKNLSKMFLFFFIKQTHFQVLWKNKIKAKVNQKIVVKKRGKRISARSGVGLFYIFDF